ncbi:MAG TPA: putative O-glycosylation ligase, exosortase A system-associated [Planctomycetota bacterium]|nr:putative O-glycosylation ligase, exosortase A system-associated [Planctomycetota bacterium]
MNLRDLVFTLVILGLLPVVWRRPFIGVLTFSWLAYMRPQDLTWGFARQQRWSFLIAAVTVAGYIASGKARSYLPTLRSHAMVLLAVVVGISALVGSPHDNEFHNRAQFNRYVEFVKIIGVALFTTAVLVRTGQLRVLMWVIALSFGFYAVKVGLVGVLTFGAGEVLQGPGGMLEDNNAFSLALCMGLPLLLEIGRSEKSKVLRRGVFLMIPLSILTIIMTRSRGGFLSLAAVVAVMVWRSRNRTLAIAMAGVLGVTALLVVPDEYIDRIKSIRDYEEDGSAMGRIAAWKTAVNMATAKPLFGVGMNMFQRNYRQYASGAEHESIRVAHNAYLQVWAEYGSIALCLYLFLIGATFWSLWRLRREARRHYYTSWIINYATMFETTLVAFVTGSTFLNRADFDLFYHLVAIVIAFEAIAWREMASYAPRTVPGLSADLVPHQRRGFDRLPRRGGFRPVPGRS